MKRGLPKFQEIGKKVKMFSTFILFFRPPSPLQSGKGWKAGIKMPPIFKPLSNGRKDSENS